MRIEIFKRFVLVAVLVVFGSGSSAWATGDFSSLKDAEGYLTFTYQDHRGAKFERGYEFHENYFVHKYKDVNAGALMYYKYYYKDLFDEKGYFDRSDRDTKSPDYRYFSVPVRTGYRKDIYTCHAASCDYSYSEIPVSSHRLVFHAKDEKKARKLLSELMAIAKQKGADVKE